MRFNEQFAQNVQNFVRKTQEAYQENSELRDVSDWSEFNQQEHGNLDYIQVGRITGIPEDIFSDERSGLGYQTLAQDLTKPIWRGELMSITDEIIDVTEESDRISVVDHLTYESLSSASRKSSADHVFLPISDTYWDTMHQWYDEGKGEYKDRELHIQTGHSELKTHWLPTDRGYESVYLMNSDQLSVIQKRYEDPDVPEQIQGHTYEELNEYSRGHHLMNYFAEGEADEIDLLQRVVFWKNLDPEGAFRIDPRSHTD